MSKKPVQTEPTTKLWVKVVCGILGFLMVFGILTMLFSTFQSVATENGNLQTREDQQISVGLYCNENAVQSYTLQSEHGFEVKGQPSDLSVKLKDSHVTAAVDGNLYRIGTELSTEKVGVATVGGYHIQITYFAFSDLGIDTDHDNPVFIRPGNTSVASDGYTPSNVEDYIELLSTNSTFKALKLPAFVYYVDKDKCYIRVGSFYTAKDAEDVLNQLENSMTLTATVVAPDDDTVTLLSEDYSILCELAGKNQTLQLHPQNDGSLRDVSGRSYSGSIAISHYSTEEMNGLSIINRLSLETYIAALLPSEIADTWNTELLKTMAVVLRTEITRKLGNHSTEGFDVCSDTHCHKYIGGASASDAIMQAVAATAGQILTYEDRPIFTPYTMQLGSSTISALDAFGKEIPYLPAIYTPWETSDEWTVEFTPYELYQLLNTAGYQEIQGNIVSIEISSRATGSDYVTEISFTDLFGTTVTVKDSETIRILFAGKLPSTCFVVGKAGDTVTRIKRTLADNDIGFTEAEETITLDGTYGAFVFVGYGNGAGVGLSIMGALSLAKSGLTYDVILERYFPGAVLTGKEDD